MIFSHKFWRIARRLNKTNLQQPTISSLDLTEDDLFNLDIGKRGGDFFLGYHQKFHCYN